MVRMILETPKIKKAAGKADINTATDEILFTAYRQGNTKAFDILFSRYQDRLCQHMERLLNNQQVGEDLVIETFLRIHHHRSEYRDGANVRAWIYTIARNLARNWLRRKQIVRWLPLTVNDSALSTPALERTYDNEIQRRVTASFARLPL